MTKSERIDLIKKIEENRGSKVICLILGDRLSQETNLNLSKLLEDDVIRYFYDILEEIKFTENLDLFLYSRGGNTEVPLKIINLLRKYCNKLGIVIPYRAHSAATMIALGGDEILMNEISELGPVDPSITTPFNPQNPVNLAQKFPIETEAILSFRDSMRKEFNLWLNPDKIASLLLQQINPIIVGSSYRARLLSKSVIENFLKKHIKGKLSFLKIRQTTNLLLRSNSHSYAIDINEAKSLGLNAEMVNGELKEYIWKLYKEYEDELKLKDYFNPVSFLGTNPTATEEFSKAIIESTSKTYSLNVKLIFTHNNQGGVQWINDEKWI